MSSGVEDFYKKKVPVVGSIIQMMGTADMDYGPFAFVVSFSLLLISLFVFGVSGAQIAAVAIALIPVWLPIMLFFVFFHKWTDFVGMKFYLNNGRTTLRIMLPQEVLKSPEAMEIVLSQIHNVANPDNLMQTYLDGKRPLPIGLELVSIGGEVRFYVNTPTKKMKDAFEVNMYAQYPGIEIREEPVDYASEIEKNSNKFGTFALHIGKKKEEVFPIKTYIEYGLDKMPKEEEKVDPMTPMLEVLASIKPTERLFIQIIIIPYRESKFLNGQLVASNHWEKSVNAKIDELMQRDPKTKAPLVAEGSDFDGSPRITSGERATIEAMERNVGKYPYYTAIRWIYAFQNDEFDGNLITRIIRSFSQYDVLGRNALGVRWRTDFHYKDFFPGKKRKELEALKQQELKEYKLRKYFPKSGADDYKIFTTEELATMFHLPGKVALTPTLTRIESARSEAPSNLPVGPAMN